MYGILGKKKCLLAAHGAHIDRYDYCPHHPTEGQPPYRVRCGCRKPLAGMLVRAAAELGLDLARSYMVGDKLTDVEAGARAGLGCGQQGRYQQ